MNNDKNICSYCNKPIESNRKYCNSKCKKKYHYAHNLVQKVCIGCKRSFKAPKGVKYCSKKCKSSALHTNTITCLVCNKEFIGTNNSKYCSNECYRYANSRHTGFEDAQCIICHKKFKRLRKDDRECCSNPCKANAISILSERIANELTMIIDQSKLAELKRKGVCYE